MRDLSVLIPSRQEEWLGRTVADVLEHRTADTEVIVVLDGAWPTEPMAAHPDVQVIHRPKSIGQRAATNLAARISTARYVMKLDAHCAVGPGFDTALIKAAEELGPDATQIPTQFNLHVYDQVCEACGKRTDQAPHLAKCECGATSFRKEVVWDTRTKTTAWRFDADLHFQYHPEGSKRPDLRHGDFIETMSCLGACWFLSRDRYWQLGGMDEKHGSWGGMGTELACKSWLSGGRMVVNTRTWFAHFFRVGQIGFPYPIHGSDQEKAREYSRRLWRNNTWPGQIHPLSWMLDYFWPVPGWSDEAREAITSTGAKFALAKRTKGLLLGVDISTDSVGVGSFLGAHGGALPPLVVIEADATDPGGRAVGPASNGIEDVAPGAVGLGSVDGRDGIRSAEVLNLENKPQVGRVTAGLVVADDVVENGNVSAIAVRDRCDEPCVQQAMELDGVRKQGQSDLPVSVLVSAPDPKPAASGPIDGDIGEEPRQRLVVEVGDSQNRVSHDSASYAESRSGAGGATTSSAPSILHQPRKGIVYYSHETAEPALLEACRRQLRRAAGGIPIVSVTLKPVNLGFNVVLPSEPGILTMVRQQLVGLKLIDADIVYFAENDCLYPPEHFEFVPESHETYYYDTAMWKVDAATGRALHYETRQLSGLCAYRALLLQHYEKRLERVEREGFSRAMGYEPGTHGRPERVDDYRAASWQSRVPYVDIRHDKNLTPSRWTKEEFRSQRNCLGWTEADAVPGWPGVTKGRFPEWLAEAVR